MSDLIGLSEAQMRRIEPYSRCRMVCRGVDDRRVLSGIVFVISNGLRWRDAPADYGPHKTIDNRFIRWSRLGVFDRIFAGLTAEGGPPNQLMSRRHAPQGSPDGGQPVEKGDVPRRIGRTKGGLNSTLHAVCDEHGRPRVMLPSEGQMSDYTGAALMLDAVPDAPVLIGDRGYDADRLRQVLRLRGIRPCIPGRADRTIPIRHGKTIDRDRHRAEIMFGRLEDWRRIHTRYDRCAHTFMSAIARAAIMLFCMPKH